VHFQLQIRDLVRQEQFRAADHLCAGPLATGAVYVKGSVHGVFSFLHNLLVCGFSFGADHCAAVAAAVWKDTWQRLCHAKRLARLLVRLHQELVIIFLTEQRTRIHVKLGKIITLDYLRFKN
jgi:hypothetical protein